MKTLFVLSVALVLASTSTLYGAGQTKGRANPAATNRPASDTADSVPVATTKVVNVPGEVEWDYAVWSDATGKHQVRAKPLSLESDRVRLEKKKGDIITVPLGQAEQG